MMSGAAHVLAAFCFLAQLIQPEAACSPGFTVYHDVDEWVAALETSTGQHCLEGNETKRISVDKNLPVVLRAGMVSEAHYVDFIGGDTKKLGGLVKVEGAFKSTHCSFKNGETTGSTFDSGAAGVWVGAGQGGGSPEFDCKDCTFENNEAIGGIGGGIQVSGATFLCENCNFKANSAEYGGGMFNSLGSTTTCNSCVFDGNVAKAKQGGGAIFNQGTLKLTDVQYLTDSDDLYEQTLWAVLTGVGGFILCCCCCCVGGCIAAACYFCKGTPPAPAAMPPQQVQMNAALNQPPVYQTNVQTNQPPAYQV